VFGNVISEQRLMSPWLHRLNDLYPELVGKNVVPCSMNLQFLCL
jgi:hypothetical protein